MSENQNGLIEYFSLTRKRSVDICEPLEVEDYVVQPHADVSPPKWHLAHTTWFFEEMVLVPFCETYKRFDESFSVLFNSYYKSAGEHWIQADRGELSRPTVNEVKTYREYVNKSVLELLGMSDQQEKVKSLIEIGLHHEQQHQELLLMDIKYILAANPSSPSYLNTASMSTPAKAMSWHKIEEGVDEIGYGGEDFSYDNERPRHKAYIHRAEVCDQLVTNHEYLEFIKSDGYKRSELWLSQGWDWVKENKIEGPLYWKEVEGNVLEFTLHGLGKLDPHMPVSHISYFEANAYARWAKARLATEQELEIFSRETKKESPQWCWTSSHYSPYPGFESFQGKLAEYNEKFMCNQFVLKGGCFATPKGHYRDSYRNFYQAHQRWMFSGIRLARSL